MVAALRAQPGGGAVSDQLPATLAALVGRRLQACGCLLECWHTPEIGGTHFRLTVEDAGALDAARGLAPAVRPASGALAAAHGAAEAPAPLATQARRQPGAAAIARSTKAPGGASGWALRTLLADPSLTALPGPIAGGARGPDGSFMVPVGALLSAGLRAARERGWWSGGGEGGRGSFSLLLSERFGVSPSEERMRDSTGLFQRVFHIPATSTSVADWLRGCAGAGGAATNWPLPDIVAAAPTPSEAPAPATTDVAATITGGGQASVVLRALLAHPAASALPGELIVRTRCGRHEVALAALYAAGLRVAELPVPAATAASGGFPAISPACIAHFSTMLVDALGVTISRVSDTAGCRERSGLLVPVGQPSVAAWLRALRAAPAAVEAAAPAAAEGSGSPAEQVAAA
jgi:hypothetical protein